MPSGGTVASTAAPKSRTSVLPWARASAPYTTTRASGTATAIGQAIQRPAPPADQACELDEAEAHQRRDHHESLLPEALLHEAMQWVVEADVGEVAEHDQVEEQRADPEGHEATHEPGPTLRRRDPQTAQRDDGEERRARHIAPEHDEAWPQRAAAADRLVGE